MRVNKVGILKEEYVNELISSNNLFCYASDLAKILGCEYNKDNGYGSYWYENTLSNDGKSKYVDLKGTFHSTFNRMKLGVRICISFDDIDDFTIDDLCIEYPMFAVNDVISKTIDKLFNDKRTVVNKTGKRYNINDVLYDEYEVFGLKFIKVNNASDNVILSNGVVCKTGGNVYLKVDKIPFVIDKENRMIYSKVILFPSYFDTKGREFIDSDLCRNLNNNFLMTINNDLMLLKDEVEISNSSCNRYNFNFSNISEEEIIEICIKSNISVFLHGKTGSGKTERMLSLDKNLELIDFGCTSSDGFTGIIAKDINSKELFLYEPYWYKNLCEKCSLEPDKIHILFLEELTNAKSDVQKVAFEVTLNKTLTNSGFRLKLPENAVVCAAGNEANESKSANMMSEPLFGRFAHVYINTDSDDWIKWALSRKKENRVLRYEKHDTNLGIHRAIIDYIKVNGDRVLRTEYNGVKPNADPRKWALASKALHNCNNPNVLRAFVGNEITDDFIKFCKMNLITIDNVLNDEYNLNDINDSSLKWYTTICLTSVDEDNVDKIRDFVLKLGPEFLSLFDYEWSKDDEKRIIKIYGNDKVLVKGKI